MSSGTWNLVVCDAKQTIDGQNVTMLAYEVSEVEDASCSKLVLGNLRCEDYRTFQSVLLSVRERNRRGQARAWLRDQERHYRLVQHSFTRLGYQTLEDKCEECGGFVVDDRPTASEDRCFQVLKHLVGALYKNFFVQESTPARRVIRNRHAAYHGMATLYKVRKRRPNAWGLKVRYDVGEIYLKESVFAAGRYFDALSTYVHEACHAFGGDSSDSFSLALTHAMELLLMGHELVEEHRRQWRAVFASA